MPNTVNNDQYELIQTLLQRQDDALEKLEALNLRVEEAIQEVNSIRESDEPDAEIAGEIAAEPVEVPESIQMDSKAA